MEKIGKYTIVRKIAEGNFAILYEATEPSPPDGLGRRVALKLCAANDELLRQRFGREVELIAQLGHHPNIASAYDIGYLDGAPYLVEEYLPGEDLRHKIERKDEVPPTTKVGWLLQTAKGLKFAHSQDIVHRDIKPENVRISPTGHVKIIDFGIGKAVSSEATRLTMDGTIMGTLGYLAPEQLRGKADLRSDIFSFGVMAYELITYTHPFTASTLREQFRVLMEKEPEPMTALWPDCPPGLESVVAGCLQKEADKRTQTFDQVVDGLRSELRKLEMEEEAEQEAPAQSGQATFILDKETLEALTEEREKKTGSGAATAAPPPAAEEPVPAAPKEQPKAAPPPPPPPAAEKPAPAAPAKEAPKQKPKAAPPPPAEKKATAKAKPAEKKPPKPAAAAPTPAAASAKPKSGFPRWLLLAIPIVVVLAVLGFWLLGREPGPSVTENAPSVPSEPQQIEPSAPTVGTLVLDAFPWADLARIEDASGTQAVGADSCTTPCSLELEPGTYTAYLVNPAFPNTELPCEFSLAAGESASCRVTFGKPTAVGYFKAVGWWR